MIRKPKVLVGLSGGIDSSITAILLKNNGYEVIGGFFHFWSEQNCHNKQPNEQFPANKCCSPDSLFRARQVASWLGIPFHTFDIKEQFYKKIVKKYLYDYSHNKTPNPCITCNQYVKSDIFLKEANKLGAEYIATGHYAKIKKNEDKYHIYRGIDHTKDQSYFLYTHSQADLSRMLLPLGKYTKKQVREMAKKYGIGDIFSDIPESQDLCFYPEKTPEQFLRRQLGNNIFSAGDIVDIDDNILGKHTGLPLYTIGQRHGLGLSGGQDILYVIQKNKKENKLVVGSKKNLYKKKFTLENIYWINEEYTENMTDISVQIRYNSKPIKVVNIIKTEVILEQPAMSITSGQSAVFYRGEELLGGGIIT